MSLLALRAILNQQGAAAWSPLDLPNLQGWWDASDDGSFTYSSGVVVSQWADLSGNGRHLAQSSGAAQPSRNGTQNGLDTVVFDGAGDYMDTAGFTISQPFTFLVACKITDGTSGFMSGGSGGNSPQMFTQGSNLWTYAGSVGITSFNIEDTAACLVATFNGASSLAYRDGTASSTLSIGTEGFTLLRLAERQLNGSYWLEGQMFELAIVSGVIADADREAWDEYIAAKWAI